MRGCYRGNNFQDSNKTKETERKQNKNKVKTKWVASHKRFSLMPFSSAREEENQVFLSEEAF